MQTGRTVRALFFLALGACSHPFVGAAQEPPQKPISPKPLILRPLPPNSPTDSTPIEIGTLQDLATRLLRHASETGCSAGKCTILVTDFVFSDGSTFPNGVAWADELTKLFSAQGNEWQVVDRTLLSDFIQKQNIPAKLANREASARWLGKKYDATIVLVGQVEMVRRDVVELSARFLSVNNENLIGPSSEVDLSIDDPHGLVPTDGLSPSLRLSPFPETVNGEKVYQPGTPGLTLANCYYMRNPPYTKDATEAKFSGIVTAEAAVGSDGILRAIRIVKGAPFGLNDEVIKTLSTWKCRPAQLDGKSAATVVPFEVNFRLFSRN